MFNKYLFTNIFLLVFFIIGLNGLVCLICCSRVKINIIFVCYLLRSENKNVFEE